MNKKILLTSLLISIGLLFSGCWDYHELNNYSIISGYAVDLTPDHKYLITIELVDVVSVSPDNPPKGILVSAEGDTFTDAFNNTVKMLGNPMYTSHAQVLIVGEEIAKDSLLPIITFLVGDPQTRMDLELVIAKDETAQKTLAEKTVSNSLSSLEISMILKSDKSKVPSVKLYQFANTLEMEGISPIMPIIFVNKMLIDGSKEKDSTTETYGIGYFIKGSLSGTLDNDESQLYMLIKRKINQNILSLKDFSIRVISSQSKIKVDTENAFPVIHIDIMINAEENYNYSKEVKDKVDQLIKRMQNNKSDIFGFGNMIYRQMPDEWDKLKENWEDNFKKLKISTSVKIERSSNNQIYKPIKINGKD